MKRKTDMVKECLAAGDYKGALRIAKGFRLGLSKEEKDTLSRGYECIVHAEWYKQLGIDTSAEIDKALKIAERWK